MKDEPGYVVAFAWPLDVPDRKLDSDPAPFHPVVPDSTMLNGPAATSGIQSLPKIPPIVRADEWFHVVNRGTEGRKLFPTPEDAAAFVRVLGEVAESLAVEVHAYCAMGTHYHLLVRAAREDLLRALEMLERAFRDRVKPPSLRRVVAGRHLLKVTRYIHRNPVEAGLVPHALDWPWSSYRGYLERLEAAPWLRSDAVLGWLGSIGARESYRRYVDGRDTDV